MKLRSILCACAASIAVFVYADTISGDWSGRLEVTKNQSLKLVFHIKLATDTSAASATFDSPDQAAYDLPAKVEFLSADSVCIKAPAMSMTFTGHLNSKGEIDGTFKQGFKRIPLVLKPGVKKANRPQTPQAPFPYSIEDITVINGEASLSGTLTLPENYTNKTPVVVLVSGSGLQNRDEELFEHKPFAVIADYLARQGIATLRYDDRGFGESTGDVIAATTADFASDAAAVVKWLRDSKRFGSVGLLGHSEGGQIAYMLGATKQSPDFLISVAGPAVSGARTLLYQNERNLRDSNIEQSVIDEFITALDKVFTHMNTTPDKPVNDAVLETIFPNANADALHKNLATSLKSVATSANPWMRYFIAYSPDSDLKNVKKPLLIIYGKNDSQVPPDINATPATKLAPRATVKIYDGLNHLMQHSTTGRVEEYSQIEETISPEVLSDIATFIKSVKKPK